MLIGMTRVFVPQDLRYMGLGTSDLFAINRRLIPLIAHDRAGFGGAIATCGLLLLCSVWFGRPSRPLWQTVFLAGSSGFITAIGVHPLIGYTEFSHLAPAYFGAAMFSFGISLCYKPMCAACDMVSATHSECLHPWRPLSPCWSRRGSGVRRRTAQKPLYYALPL